MLVNDYFIKNHLLNYYLHIDENFGTKVCLKDINDLDTNTEIHKMKILTFGFPCQPFSIANNIMKLFK